MRQLYYRSDTRSPSIIFNKGFQPRSRFALNNAKHGLCWGLQREADLIENSIKLLPKMNLSLGDFTVDDASPNYAICLTRNFTSAAMFPIPKLADIILADTYIYFVVLPDAISLQLAYGPHYQAEAIPAYTENTVFDLHSLQIQQADYILAQKHGGSKFDPRELGWPLYAYENFAAAISPRNILGAVQIKRRPYTGIKIPSVSVSGKARRSKEIEFNLHSTFMKNPNFCLSQPRDISLMKEIRCLIASLTIKKSLGLWEKTPSVAYALGGTLLPVPTEKGGYIMLPE
jgi:hypothetical protein